MEDSIAVECLLNLFSHGWFAVTVKSVKLMPDMSLEVTASVVRRDTVIGKSFLISFSSVTIRVYVESGRLSLLWWRPGTVFDHGWHSTDGDFESGVDNFYSCMPSFSASYHARRDSVVLDWYYAKAESFF